MPPSAMTGTPAFDATLTASATALICGTPNACHDPRRADGARADTHLDAVRAGFDQCLGCIGTDNVAADDLQIGILFFRRAHPLKDTLGKAVRRIDDDDIDAGLDQRRNPFIGFAGRADRRADPQRTLLILARQRIIRRLLEILGGDEAAQFEILIDDEHFLDAMLVQQRQHFGLAGIFTHGHELVFRRHDGGDGCIELRLETQIAIRDDADRFALVDDGHAGNVIGLRQLQDFANCLVRGNGNRVAHDAAFVFLDHRDLFCLVGDTHVLMDNAHAAFLGHRDRQAGFGDGIHGCGQQRNIQLDPPGNAGLQSTSFGKTFE